MSAKSKNLPQNWVDPDEAPELGQFFFENATWRVNGNVVESDTGQAMAHEVLHRDFLASEEAKMPINIRLSPNVIKYFKSTGKDWQARVDEALKEYVASRR